MYQKDKNIRAAGPDHQKPSQNLMPDEFQTTVLEFIADEH